MINNRIDGVSGLEGGRLEAEGRRYERGRRGGFSYTKGREGNKRAVKQADFEAITSIAEDEREKWIDSQGLSFGDPSNIPLYLGNLSIFIRAMESGYILKIPVESTKLCRITMTIIPIEAGLS